jgi:hypothetical protein
MTSPLCPLMPNAELSGGVVLAFPDQRDVGSSIICLYGFRMEFQAKGANNL